MLLIEEQLYGKDLSILVSGKLNTQAKPTGNEEYHQTGFVSTSGLTNMIILLYVEQNLASLSSFPPPV